MKDSDSSQHGAIDSHEHGSQADREINHVGEGREREQEHNSRISLEQEYEHQQEQEQQADRAYDDGWSSNGGPISDRIEDTSNQQACWGNNSTWEQGDNNADPGCYDNLQINSDGLLTGYSQQEVPGNQPDNFSAFHQRQPSLFYQNIDPSLLTMPPLDQAHFSRYEQAPCVPPYLQQPQVVQQVIPQGSIQQLQIPQPQTFLTQRADYNQAIVYLAASQQGGNISGFQPLSHAQVSSVPTANLGSTSQLPPAVPLGPVQRWRSLQYGPYLQGTRTPRKVVRYAFLNQWLEANRSDIPLPDSSGQGFRDQNAAWERLSPQEQAACDAWMVTRIEAEQARHRANGTARYFVPNLTPAAVVRRTAPTAVQPSSHSRPNIVLGPDVPPSLTNSLNQASQTTQNPAGSFACDNSDGHWPILRQSPAAATALPPLQSMQYQWTWPSQSRHPQQHTSFQPQNQGDSFMQYDQSISYIAAQTNAGRPHFPQINMTGNGTTSEIHPSQSIHWNDPQAPMHSGLCLDHAPEFYSSQSHQQDGMSPTQDLRNGRRLSGDQNSGASSMDIPKFQHEPAYNTLTRDRATQNPGGNYMDEIYPEYDHDKESDDDSGYDRPPKITRRS